MIAARLFKTAYGNTLEVTIQSASGEAKDISSFTGLTLIADKPNSGTATRFTMTKKTDGTDGIATYTFHSGDVDAVGHWLCQIELVKSGVKVFTERFSIVVESIIE